MLSPRRPVIAVTPGDPAGIGPEIVWKAIQTRQDLRRKAIFLCVGAKKPFEDLGMSIHEIQSDHLKKGFLSPPSKKGPLSIWLLPAPTQPSSGRLGKGFSLGGFQSGWAIEQATHLVRRGFASALVTGPISKERLQAGGYPYPGHTEFLADLCGRPSQEVTMMLANDFLRVSMVTTHIALKNVSLALSRQKLRRTVLQTAEALIRWWGIRRPKIAIAALNPHGGEGGLFGDEETRIIQPEITFLKKLGKNRSSEPFSISGPLSADTLFAKHLAAKAKDRFDAVVCMYHDQGLIPVKLLDFPKTVNITLGLPLIRTSVDHGVGFDIAGTGKADPSSFVSAMEMAIRFLERKSKTR